MAKTFGELEIYKRACLVNELVWALRFKIKTDSPGLWYQLDKSAGSISDNIAEGFGRDTRPDFKNFLRYARGSTLEAHCQVDRALNRQLISPEEGETLISELTQLNMMIKRFQEYLDKPRPSR